MIPFTQYLRPDGRRILVKVERPPEIEAKAQAILDAGFVFECEILRNGHVSFTISDPKEEEDVAIELCVNDPLVSVAIDKLITEFNLERFSK